MKTVSRSFVQHLVKETTKLACIAMVAMVFLTFIRYRGRGREREGEIERQRARGREREAEMASRDCGVDVSSVQKLRESRREMVMTNRAAL